MTPPIITAANAGSKNLPAAQLHWFLFLGTVTMSLASLVIGLMVLTNLVA
ncbi:MAG: hypothetical protein ACWA5L_07685 [bacterium]